MEFSIKRLSPLTEEMSMIIQQDLVGQEGCAEREIENEFRKSLQELRWLTFGMLLSQADDTPELELPCECGCM